MSDNRVKRLKVGELKKIIEDVPDELEIKISSDTGVDQGEGEIVVESASRINYNLTNGETVDYFEIYCNDICNDEDEYEDE